MLSRVTAKNVGDVFRDTVYLMAITAHYNILQTIKHVKSLDAGTDGVD